MGIVLGFVTSVILLPRFFTEKQNGVLTLLQSYSMIYSQFALIGVHTTIIRFFPYFKDENSRHKSFLSIMSAMAFVGFIGFLVYYYLTKPAFKEVFEKSPLFEQHYFYLLPLTFFTLYYYVFDAYSTAQHKPVRGFLYKDVIQRIVIILCIVAFVAVGFSFPGFVMLYCAAICLPTLLFVFNFLQERQVGIKIDHVREFRPHLKSIMKVSGYSLLLGVSWVGVTNLDAVMIERLMDLDRAGIYGRMVFFGLLVTIPYRATHKVASGHLSSAFKEGDMQKVKDIYYKSCLTQLIIGGFILCGVWLNNANILSIMPPAYAEGKYVILFVGLGNLAQMAGGVNTAVLSYSPHYRWNAYFVCVLLAMIIALNYWLIPLHGITGAAVSAAISLFLYNLLMYAFLWIRYGFQPMGWRHLAAIAILLTGFFAAYILPAAKHWWLDAAFRSLVFALISGVLILVFKVSPDITNMTMFIYRKFFSQKRA